MTILDSIDWVAVRRHYDDRIRVSKSLIKLHRQESVNKFANLALGITDDDSNYSAAEHGLGPKILHPDFNLNAEQRVFDLAGEFMCLTSAHSVPKLITSAHLAYLKIGVGSEISCMVNPEVCWVANTRTIWTDLVITHDDSIQKADEQLRYYRTAEVNSEMDYQNWAAMHAELRVSLTRIAEIGQKDAAKHKVSPGSTTYIWADAIASALYGMYHD